jgi:prepilin signal peptidase PulO-like enzyme (type II secretory pathway)
MIYIISFIFWIIFGSFISVLVWRIKNNEKGIFLWRSKCPNCNHTLSAFDLVPIFSYWSLWWKCRYCQNKISIIYPILELVTWLTFAFITYFFISNYFDWNQYLPYIIYWWMIWVFIVAISFYDILFYEISFSLASIFAILVLIPQFLWIIWNWEQALILWISGFLVFIVIIYLREKVRKIEGMWWWDAIWAALIWFIFPIILQISWLDTYPIWIGFYITILFWFISAGFVGIIFLILWKGKKFAIPFLPFMFLGLVLFIFFGEKLISFIVN